MYASRDALIRIEAKTLQDFGKLKELGVDMTFSLTRGVMLPKGTAKEIVDHWAEIFKGPTQDAKFVAQQAAKGTSVLYLGPQDYAKWWEATSQDFVNAAKELKMGRFK